MVEFRKSNLIYSDLFQSKIYCDFVKNDHLHKDLLSKLNKYSSGFRLELFVEK